MNPSEYQSRVKAETTFGDTSIDMATGATILEMINPVTPVQPTKVTTDLNSNYAHPFRRKAVFGRNNTGQLNTLLHKTDHQLLVEIMFGGTFTAGVPQRNKSYALQTRKSSISGSLAVGVRPQSVDLTATNGGPVNLAYSLVAKHENDIAAPTIGLPTTREQPYKFATAIAVLNGTAANKVESISLNLAHNLEIGPYRESSMDICSLDYGTADLTGSADFKFEAETYNDLVRGTATGFVYLLFGDAMAIHNGTAWSTDDLFTATDAAVTYNGTVLAADTVASVGPLALTTLITPSNGDVVVQNPVLIKLNSVEIPSAPENGGSGVVKQTLNFEVTSPSSGSVNPVEVFMDGIT